MGGFCSMFCTSVFFPPLNQRSPTWILPIMATLPAGPLRMVTSPECVNTSRSAAPLTVRVFSKCPCSDATARVVPTSKDRTTATDFANPGHICVLLVKLFIAQRLHRSHVSRTLCGVHPGRKRDKRKSNHRNHNGNRRNDRMRDEIWQGQVRKRQARAHSEGEPKHAAQSRQDYGLGKELAKNVRTGSSHCFAYADLAG